MRFNSSLGVKTIPMPHSYSVHSFTVGFLWPGSTYCWQIKVFYIGIKSETGYVGHWRIHHSILSFNDNCYEKLALNTIFQCNIFMQRYNAIKLSWNSITVISRISANKDNTKLHSSPYFASDLVFTVSVSPFMEVEHCVLIFNECYKHSVKRIICLHCFQ